VFDDGKVGLVQEPFIAGADTVIDRMVANIPNAEEGINLMFSVGWALPTLFCSTINGLLHRKFRWALLGLLHRKFRWALPTLRNFWVG
jgi:hypothetical protein